MIIQFTTPLSLATYFKAHYYRLTQKSVDFGLSIFVAVVTFANLFYNTFIAHWLLAGVLLVTFGPPILKYILSRYTYAFLSIEYFFRDTEVGYKIGAYSFSFKKDHLRKMKWIAKTVLLVKTKNDTFYFFVNDTESLSVRSKLQKSAYSKYLE